MAGLHKHKFSWVTTKAPDYFGYKGFFSRGKTAKVINVGDLSRMGESEIDLKKLGFQKLLGKGKIDHAVVVSVEDCSVQAKEKIEKAGGRVQN